MNYLCARGCPPLVTVSPQVLQYLQAEQMDILVAGDSMMRQLYVRLVHMMRGAHRVLDYHIHTPGSYSVCAEADRFRMSPVNGNRSVESFKKLDLDYLEVWPSCSYACNTTAGAYLLCASAHHLHTHEICELRSSVRLLVPWSPTAASFHWR